MIVEVNDAGEILIPAELVQAPPHTRLSADREGDSVVLKPLAEKTAGRSRHLVDSLPILEGHLADPSMTFRREDLYGPDARERPLSLNEHSEMPFHSAAVPG
ncbi:MAG: hypothetical protein ABSB35_09300 [Bryobacteraceae bacterium]|jgi:bifunctional DNA-binding transcriptional regulator/antitoxin component of YhaV-PrlF toxin-antitoxin module